MGERGRLRSYIHTYIHTYTQGYIHTYVYPSTYIHTYTQGYIHTYVYPSMSSADDCVPFFLMCVNSYKHTQVWYIQTPAHTHTHTHTHVRICACFFLSDTRRRAQGTWLLSFPPPRDHWAKHWAPYHFKRKCMLRPSGHFEICQDLWQLELQEGKRMYLG
jgi:hypothetical protein